MAARATLSLVVAGALAVAVGPAVAQAHTAESSTHTLRVDTLRSDQLPEEAARTHGIVRAEDRVVLNAVVLAKGRALGIPAEVTAVAQNLLGQKRTIEMREVRESGGVSYLGSFEFGPLRNFTFVVTARPAGGGQPLTVEFDDRFFAKR